MDLGEFVTYWLAESPMRPPMNVYERVADSVGVNLYRDAQFQVQMWAFSPGTEITDHSHPDVESWVVRVGGDFEFRKYGRPIRKSDVSFGWWRGHRVPMLHLAPNDSHGASVGPAGGSFLSISERKDGKEPASVHLSWSGPPLDDAHASKLGEV